MLHALIMAGGGGTRFWPRSRQRCPKQFLKLSGDRTLLQQALDRLEVVVPPERTWIITADSQRALVAEQLPQLPAERIVGEPCGRDTATCIGLGAALIQASDPEAVMVVTPADHVIAPEQEFRRAVQAAAHLAEEHPQAFLTMGIPPTYPATGYGYIRKGAALPGRMGIAVFRLDVFREKPDRATAERYLALGEYVWNSGIFLWKARTVLDALRQRHPGLHAAVVRVAEAWNRPEREQVFRREYEPLPRLSIDFAVMEGCAEGLILQAPFHWDDVGSWRAVERMYPQDEAGNTILATHCGLDTRDTLVVGEPGRLIATVGVKDLIIVQDGDATLIAHRGDEEAIKKLVAHLKQRGWDRYL
jgi:mannose-1-phosphate guanylyltransferase